MRNARMTGWGAAALAAVLVTSAAPAVALPLEESAPAATPGPAETVAPAPTAAPEPEVSDLLAAAAGVGDLTVTVFEDRYQDGVFDPSKTGRQGQSDAIRQYLGAPTLVASDGTTWTSTEVDGKWFFDDVPAGEAKLRVEYPTIPVNAMLFDATDSAHLVELTQVGSSWDPRAEASVTIGDGTSSSRSIGISGLRAVADVKLPDGTPATGATVELGANGQWLPATEYDFQPGSYEHLDNGYVYLLPGEFGVRVTATAGYRVDEVTAVSSGGNIDPIPVTARDGAYWLTTTDASTYTSNPTFTVTLEELPTGDLTITRFDDRYADGIFDATKGEGSNVDRKNTDLSLWVKDAAGAWHYGSSNAEGDYIVNDVVVGEAEVYLGFPNNPAREALFDATGAASSADIERLPMGERFGPAGVATVTIDEDGESLLIGMTALAAAVAVVNPDGSPAVSLGDIEFGSGGEWFTATEYAGLPGSYAALNGTADLAHLPEDIGLRLGEPDGFDIAAVTAEDSISSAELAITERDGAYWIKSTDLANYFSRADFTVTLEEQPTASVDVTYFSDFVLDGVYDAASDEALTGLEMYLLDAEGEWWATTSGEDGEYRFSGVAPGEATVYAQIPEVEESPELPAAPGLELPEAALAIWDATDPGMTYRDTVRAPVDTISFDGGTFIGLDGTTTPIDVQDELVGSIPVLLDIPIEASDPQDVLIGSAAVFQLAIAADVETELPTDNVEIEFSANSEPADATEVAADSGVLMATRDGELAVFGAAEYGITVTPAAGYEVVEVTAIGLDGGILEVAAPTPVATGRMALFAAPTASYRVAPEMVGGPVGAVLWTVAVAPAAVAPIDPGVAPVDPGVGLPQNGEAPAAVPATGRLAATGVGLDVWTWMLAAALLIAAGATTRVAVRRRQG